MKLQTTMIDTVPSLLDGVKSRLPSHQAMAVFCAKAKALIEQRTLRGISSEGVPFQPYKTKRYYAPIVNRPPGYPMPSGGKLTGTRARRGKTMRFESYESYKQKIGFGGRPQLSISNQMLSDIIWVIRSEKKGVMFFASRLSAAKAHRHHTGRYPFFGFAPGDRSEMDDALLNEFKSVRAAARRQLRARRSRSR